MIQIVSTPAFVDVIKAIGERLDMEPNEVIEYAIFVLQDALNQKPD